MYRSIVGLAATLAVPCLLGGQIIPGAKPPDRNVMHAQYMDALLKGVRVTDARFLDAWKEDDIDGCVRQYVDEAFIITPEGDRISGKAAIGVYLSRTLPRTASLVKSLVEVDGSDRMAMTLENFVLPPSAAGQPTVRGLLVTVYKSDGRNWRIRSQIFRPIEADAT